MSPGQFFVGVIENLDRMGLCADFDGEEIQVKGSNALNDQYHIITSNFILRRGESMYRATCFPASFPTPAPPLNPTPGLPPGPQPVADLHPRAARKYLLDVDRAHRARWPPSTPRCSTSTRRSPARTGSRSSTTTATSPTWSRP